jgi:hypothetical protein
VQPARLLPRKVESEVNLETGKSDLSKIHNVVVEIHRPTETYPGQVAEGKFCYEDNVVTLVDYHGNPVKNVHGRTLRKK